MEFVEGIKVELDEEDLEMREKGYKFRLWLEVEDEYGMRFRRTEYFKSIDEMREYTKRYFEMNDDLYFSDREVIDLEKEEYI